MDINWQQIGNILSLSVNIAKSFSDYTFLTRTVHIDGLSAT